MTFSNARLVDCFLEASIWLNQPGQDGVNVLAITAELELPEDDSGLPDMHHLNLVYTDGNEPADEAELAAYRAKHERQL